ncbi:MAG: hypothetical protein QMC57_04870, partial [Nitrosopumilus sp.]
LCVVNDSNKNITLNIIHIDKLLKGCISFFYVFLNKFKEKLGENLNGRKTLLINEKPMDIWL